MPSNINKLKTLSENILAVGYGMSVSFPDVREKSCNTGVRVGREVKSICVMGEDLVSYGCINGTIGLVDRRKMNRPLWSNGSVHHSRVYDMCRLGGNMVSCDGKGVVASWSAVQ